MPPKAICHPNCCYPYAIQTAASAVYHLLLLRRLLLLLRLPFDAATSAVCCCAVSCSCCVCRLMLLLLPSAAAGSCCYCWSWSPRGRCTTNATCTHTHRNTILHSQHTFNLHRLPQFLGATHSDLKPLPSMLRSSVACHDTDGVTPSRKITLAAGERPNTY